jgi:hypothetical protein
MPTKIDYGQPKLRNLRATTSYVYIRNLICRKLKPHSQPLSDVIYKIKIRKTWAQHHNMARWLFLYRYNEKQIGVKRLQM